MLLGLVALLGGLAARYAAQRAEHQRLREQELGRAPVVAPKRATPASLPSAPSATSCLTGLVLDHGTPVSGMQVSVSDAPLSVSGDCPCERPAAFCGCREGLAAIPNLPRAGLVEAVKSAVTGAGGRFELCGIEGDGPRLVWGEHLDGRLATPPAEQSPFIKPGASVELHVLALLPVQGVVLADQAPVPNATVLAFGAPPLFVRTFTTDARGRFEARLPLGTSDFVIAAKGFTTQRVDQFFNPQQVLVLQLKRQGDLTVRALFEERPVAGAEVTIGPEAPVLTDAQGLARFPLQVASRLALRVTKGELVGTSSVTILEGQPRRIDVTLEKGVRMRGVVVDEQGQPRAGARVRGLGKGKPILSDEAGRFTSGLLVPTGELRPVASAEGCADSEYRAIAFDEPNVTLTLACGETGSGVVLDAEGKPIEGAVVFLDGLDSRESVTTDAAGTFRFHQAQGMYQLRVSHDRYRTHEQPLQLPAKDVVLVLDAGGSISGRVVNGQGEGVAGASVTVVPAVLDELLAEVEGGNTRATTDAEGRFQVPGLLAGRLVASATADSLGTVVSDVVVLQPGEHKEGLVLTLEERVDLSGTVLDEQRRPIPGARVKWDPADEKSALLGVLMDAVRGHVDQVLRYMPSPSITDADGRYVLRGLPVSRVKLDVSAAGFADVEQLASRGDTVDFVLKKTGGRVRGRVVDEAGHPLPRFSVDGAAFTPDDGRFEVEAFGKDDTLFVSAAGYSRQSVQVVMDGAVKDVGDVVMKKGRQLQVEVRGPDHKPLPGVKVAAAQAVDGDSCTTKADGKCVIEPLLDVQTVVKAAKEGFAPVSVTVEAGKIEQPLLIDLATAGGRITGIAFAAPGQPAPARSVSLSGDVFKGVLTDGEGRFSADGLPEGRYCASLDSRNVRGLEWAVTVQASATPSPVLVGPAAQGGVLVGARTLPGRLVLLQGTAGPMELSRVLEASASNLCDSLGVSAITTITTGDFRVEGVPPGRWSAFFVSFSQVEDKGEAKPVVIELLAGETKTLP
ncbi:MAG: carboxypeptidase-like regulatory domain-containing protein [Archangium sp.]|nr:carboxypeptidase-like regulatory domain-containing protein [Archangium sp.]